jgi:hypothetical protein
VLGGSRGTAVLLAAFAAGAAPGAIAGTLVASRTTSHSVAQAVTAPATQVVVAHADPTGAERTVTFTAPAVAPPAVEGPTVALRRSFEQALIRGVHAADRVGAEGGHAEAAIWVDSWPAPLSYSSPGSPAQMRLWSTAKPVTALAVLASARAAHQRPRAALQRWMEAAFERSENCPEREMVLYLQALNGNAAVVAADAFRNVLAAAGVADAWIPTVAAGSQEDCTAAAARLGPLPYPFSSKALLLGTATWTIRDAAAFAHALAIGVYGPDGERVITLLRAPKTPSTELTKPSDFTAPPAWGAGDVFAAWQPAYKAGWGGSRNGDFMVEQYVVLRLGGHNIGIAAAYHPRQQPAIDDPGLGNAWTALEDIFLPLRQTIEQAYQLSGPTGSDAKH